MIKWFKEFWKRHIIDEFPQHLPDECFICNKGSCDNCHILRRYKL